MVSALAMLPGCVNDDRAQQKSAVQTPVSASNSSPVMTQSICPIPPLGYEKIPGYQPGSVEPSRSKKSLAFISPTLEGNPTFYLSILQQPVRFCGVAKGSIAKVKLFASGIYIYEKRYPNPVKPELLLGEAPVKSGIWFFSYDFRGYL